MLNENINYIVSGLERSGTSLVMQMLDKLDIPIAYDDTRKADKHNPRGYFELEKGKIIKSIMDNRFPFSEYAGKFIKVTAYGLLNLPPLKCKVIFIDRHMDEILVSMSKMSKQSVDYTTKEHERLMNILLYNAKQKLINDRDIEVTFISYNKLLTNPDGELDKIQNVIGEFDKEIAKKAISKRLYRNKI